MGESWADGPLVAFDLETTGVDVETARIVTACVVEVRPSRSPDVQVWLAAPDVDIPAEATAVHGITTEHAREHGRPADQVASEVAQRILASRRIPIPLVIYNAPFDLTVLDRELRRHHYAGLPQFGNVVDPLVIDRGYDRYRRGSRKLIDVCRHYGIQFADEDAHTSEGDAMAAARLAWRLAQVYPVSDLGSLQVRQAGMHAEWAALFEDYLRRKGKPEHIDRSWPIRPFVARAGQVA